MNLAPFRQSWLSLPLVACATASLLAPGPRIAGAGDILRGGASAGSPSQRAAAANRSTAAAAAAARANARDHLARTTQALRSVQALQAAAQAAAAGNNAGLNPNAPGTRLPNVPNGLRPGGLEVDPGVAGGTAVWSGASAPTESVSGNRRNVNIRQTQQTALLSWRTFNVGRDTTLRFDQSAARGDVSKWVAFNKVDDPSSAPSQILGSIEAPGQVYVINRNGILFGAGSQVNTGTLVASSLPINDNLVARGLLNNPDAQFLFSGIAIPAGAQGTPAFTPEPVNPAIGRYGDVIVQAGASLSSPTNAANSGGRIMLVGPNVRQGGHISTPDGQTILAAGLQVGIAAHSSNDPGLRGLDVYIGSVHSPGAGNLAGLVDQSGIVTTARGNITLAGREVRHSGALLSSTSVSLNGRIDIQASYGAISNSAYNPSSITSGAPFLPQETGTVHLGRDSLVRILPERGSAETVIGRELALRSAVNVRGRAIHLASRASIQATSGDVTLVAGEWFTQGLGGSNPIARFLQSTGQVYLDRGSLIDVAGSTAVPVSIRQFLLSLELRGAELANSPLQRASNLREALITIDVRNQGTHNGLDWIGTPLGDATGFVGLIQRTIGEFTTPGGRVAISAGDSVVMRPGSEIDVSGGYLNYRGAMVKTTRLVLGNRLVDIRDATPDRLYDGIYSGRTTTASERWGVRRTYDQPLALTGAHYESDYTQGAPGGRIDIVAPAMALDGELVGRSFDGPRQREESAAHSSLSLTFTNQDRNYPNFPAHSPTPPNIVFDEIPAPGAVPAFAVDAASNPLPLPADRLGRLVLSPDLLGENGFGHLTVANPDGNIHVPSGIVLAAPAAGSISLSAANLRIDGTLSAPGGSLAFSAANLSLDEVNRAEATQVKPGAAPGRGGFHLGTRGVLDTSGLLVDERAGSIPVYPSVTAGGSVAIAAYHVHLNGGSLVDVSGGARIDPRGGVTYGDAGTISIDAGRDLAVDEVFGGRMHLDGRLVGLSGSTGGTLSLSALAFQVGGNASAPAVTRLDPSFFSRGGFASFSLTGMGLPSSVPGVFTPGVLIAEGTTIRPVAQSLLVRPNTPAATGAALTRVVAPEGLRNPVSLSFKATGASDSFNLGLPISRGDVVLGRGATIRTDALGAVALNGQTVSVSGTIVAPGGLITLRGADSIPLSGEALSTVYLDDAARLSTAGSAVIWRGPNQWREGFVTSGGTISLSGNLVTESGAHINVSGAAGTLDLPAFYRSPQATASLGFSGQRYLPVRYETDGGTVNLVGSQMLYSDAALIGRGGGDSALGGTLNVTSGRFIAPGTPYHSAEADLLVQQNGRLLPDSPFARGVGLGVRDAAGLAAPGIGRFVADGFHRGGFASLSLGGNVDFRGSVHLDAPASLRVASGGTLYADDRVVLDAPYVALGQAFRPPALLTDQIVLYTQTDAAGITTPYQFSPVNGPGSLVVRAETLDIGTLSLHGIGRADLRAPGGDIRGNGTLQIAGDLVMRAGQIYPTTLSAFQVFAYDSAAGDGSVTILGGADRPTPLSAGGSLSIHATHIVQNGTLKAPIGSIRLGWDGSGDVPLNPIAGSTSAAPVTDDLRLGSHSLTSVTGIDSKTGRHLLIPFGISFDGDSWIDPAGNDVTVGGIPAKEVNLSAATVTTERGSVVDLRGGGDLYAYRWINGNGGTRDILASSQAFAVMPGYDFAYAPYAPFNSTASLQGEAGFTNASLSVGDQITIGRSGALRAGTYTLLPARYALLPGAVLVTPLDRAPVGSHRLEDGASLVSGYRSSDLDPGRRGVTSMQAFELAPAALVRQRAEYVDFSANHFLRRAAHTRGFAAPRLPLDAGFLSFSSIHSMDLSGQVNATPHRDGRGALVDISSPGDILVNRDGSGGGSGVLALSTTLLNQFKAESLLLGGKRVYEDGIYRVSVATANITVDNAGAPLRGSDLILSANESIALAEGAAIEGIGNERVDPVRFGDETVIGSGDGVFVRVSGGRAAETLRLGVSSSAVPSLTVGAHARLSGGSITLDSTYGTDLDPSAGLFAPTLSLHSGQISVRLDNAGPPAPGAGLVLTGHSLATIQESTTDLTLLSYSSIDLHGTGAIGSRALQDLTLESAAIRGHHQSGGDFKVVADRVRIENSVAAAPIDPAPSLDGRLLLDASEIVLGRGDTRTEGFSQVVFGADSRLLVSGEGSFESDGDLLIRTPLVTGSAAAKHRIRADGTLALARPASSAAGAFGGLGASLTLEGDTVTANTDFALQSGELTLSALSGDLLVGTAEPTRLDLGGVSRAFLDVVKHSSAGTIRLESAAGSVRIGSHATLDLSAPAGGGNAGLLAISAPQGSVDLGGAISGRASATGRGASFALDAATVPGGDLAATDAVLNAGGFDEARTYRIRTGDLVIGGTARASDYRAFADTGSIVVTGTIDASGSTGGTIELGAHLDLTLAAGSLLDASAEHFSAAGKGGSIFLGAGASLDGWVDPGANLNLAGGLIDLSVAAETPDSASRGQFAGTLHLRAPQNAAHTDAAIDAIGTQVAGASSVFVEAFRVYDLTGSGALDNALLAAIKAQGDSFLGAAGSASAAHATLHSRLTSIQPGLEVILGVGAEIINRSGDLTLGSSSSTEASDWNLAGLRFGPDSAPGVLTLRAQNDIDLHNAISDGFGGGSSLWLSPLLAQNPNLPANTQSWSFRMAAGADFAAADSRGVRDLDDLAPDAGMIRLGKNSGSATASGGPNAQTSDVIANHFQVIRTGSGDIDLHAGRSIQLLNPFASIYTAGTQVEDPTGIFAPGDFVTPVLTSTLSNGSLGSVQQNYPAQYAMAGGDVTLTAGGNIERKTENGSGLIDDASRQLPNHWLYRRGHVGPNGHYGQVTVGSGFINFNDPAASTSWWVDYSNFFQSVGALGGGDVTLLAGSEIRNVDAVIPTNARAARGVPDPSRLVELGGGDLLVRSGGDISGGVYYVERGVGRLEAGGSVTTNAARSPSLGPIQNLNNPSSAQLDPLTWMPTSLFLGRSSFDVSARGDVLLGPMANAFLLPQGLNNRFWYKTYFSTYSDDAAVRATSLGGDVTFRNAVTLPQHAASSGTLRAWMDTQNLLSTGPTGAAYTQPWLRLVETNLEPFSAVMRLAPPTLEATSFAGDIQLAGDLTLYPAARGQLEWVAAGQIDAFQPTGRSNLLVPGRSVVAWTASSINVSDADPDGVPGAVNPFSYYGLVGSSTNFNNATASAFLDPVARYFIDSGSTSGNFGVATTKQALHDSGLLHRHDPAPLRLYALGGSLSGLTLHSPKPSRIHASQDITDIAFYLQNLSANDSTIVSAGRDIIPNNPVSPLRNASFADGNFPASGQTALAGDIHLGGPGSLQVLAGRHLDLGIGADRPDGSGSGILTIGNTRNLALPFGGGDLFIGAGLGPITSLSQGRPDIERFVREHLKTPEGLAHLREIGAANFDTLGQEERAQIALAVFYLVLRDAGRNHNDPDSRGYGNYDAGFAAIRSLFPGRYDGEILTRSRNIRTQNGGDISIFAPGGGLTLANTTLGNSLVPPGIVTESGGSVSIFTRDSVDIGVGRIFTLRGGDMVIWSSRGDIAAGVASKTVQSAPPTRVLIDPQSAALATDLAGLATGGGIGVLATVAGIRPGNVDLIAPAGIIDAGDAGIRVTGNINLAATQVVNASNIAVGGSASGAPSAPAVSAPNVGGLTAGASSTAAAGNAAMDAIDPDGRSNASGEGQSEDLTPSLITVEVLGYGGGSAEENEDEEEGR